MWSGLSSLKNQVVNATTIEIELVIWVEVHSGEVMDMYTQKYGFATVEERTERCRWRIVVPIQLGEMKK